MRIIAIILTAAILLMLPACDKANSESTKPPILPTIVPGSTCEDVALTLTGIDRTSKDTVLQITINNNSDQTITYGEMFSLQYYQNDTWQTLKAKENTGFISIAYELESQKSAAKAYTTAWIYGTLQPGTYRFVTNCCLKDGTVCDLWIDFTLGTLPEETLDPDVTYSASPYKTPPALTITLGNSSNHYDSVCYSWNYATGDGSFASVIADARHPLECKDTLVLVDTTQTDGTLKFSDWPDDLIIRCWPDSRFGNPNAESEAVMTWNRTFTLKPATTGGYVYEITATWNDDGGLFHGTAHYYLYIASYPVMPIHAR